MTTTMYLDIDISRLFEEWLKGLVPNTARIYKYRLSKLTKINAVSIETFAHVNLNEVIDKLCIREDLSLDNKKALSSFIVSFSRVINRRTQGQFRIASMDGSVFKRRKSKVKCNALGEEQLERLLKALSGLGDRAFLIRALCLFGAKRINEVLGLTCDRINWVSNEVSFVQSKTKKIGEIITATFPEVLMQRLRKYVGDRTGLVFVTRTNTPVSVGQVCNDFHKAAGLAEIHKKVTSHSMRTSAITHWIKNHSPHQVMKITGHQTVEQVLEYDKSSQADNLTRYDRTLDKLLGEQWPAAVDAKS